MSKPETYAGSFNSAPIPMHDVGKTNQPYVFSVAEKEVQGRVYSDALSTDLCVTITGVRGTQGYCMEAPAALTGGDWLHLIFIRGLVSITGCDLHQQFINGAGIFLLTTPADYPAIKAVQDGPIKKIDICFPAAWLHKRTGMDNELMINSTKRATVNKSFLSLNICSGDDLLRINEIHQRVFTDDFSRLFLKARVYSLIESAIDHVQQSMHLSKTYKPGYVDQLARVENKLMTIPLEQRPDLKKIAKEAGLSDSTLKRRFSQVYGQSPYEYYLTRKMKAAYDMLTLTSLTVSDVAYRLGYEKASPFIICFRKHYSVSPGSLKKRNNIPGNATS